jgi:PHD/YefM family antitoxin component YafN of YafNO toxin-antitoxin module
MMQPTNVTARDILRNYKAIITKVKTTKQPAIVVSKKEPQVAIVSMGDLQRLTELDQLERNQRSTKSLLETAMKIRELLKDEKLPKDLSVNHDIYHYEEEEK